MKKLNWGIIGLGNIAQRFSEGFFEVKNANLLAVASRNLSKLEIYKNRFKIEKKFIFNNYEDLLKCKDIDIVYIALPNFLHYQWILKCIEFKKKVLVEKPATLNFEEAQNIKKILDEKNFFFTEGYMYRYHPLIKKLVELIKAKEIGDLISMETSFGINLLTKKKFFFFKKKKRIDSNNRIFNKKMGGGCILDLGCYTTSFSLLIASINKNINLDDVSLKNIKINNGWTDVEIDAEAELLFNNSFKSRIRSSFMENLGNKTVIKGEKGIITLNNSFLNIGGLELSREKKTIRFNNSDLKNIYSYEIENISKYILDEKKQKTFPLMSIKETLINMKIIDNWKNNLNCL